jgi:hypothetical protein
MRGPGRSFVVVRQAAPSSFHARQQCQSQLCQQQFQQQHQQQ